MAPNSAQLIITETQRELIVNQLSNLLKENSNLKQNLQQNQLESRVKDEQFLLEILEVFDAIESLLTVLKEQNQGENRIVKNLVTIEKKILNILKKREVYPMELTKGEPDYNLCRVVAQEMREDLPEKIAIKIVRQGFLFQEKILRPTEIIIIKNPKLLVD